MFDYVFLELEDHRQDPFNFQYLVSAACSNEKCR